MKNKRGNLIKVLMCYGMWAILIIAPASTEAVTNADYTALPPFLSTSIPPNVMIVLDNSGSMDWQAYPGSYDTSQFASGMYYGYFDATKYYQYTNNGRWEEATGTKMCSITTATSCTQDSDCPGGETCISRPIPATGPQGAATTASPIANGSLLNWATSRRVDVAKKLLIGGKATPRSPSAGVTVKLYGEAGSSFTNTHDNSTGVANLIAPFTGNYSFNMGTTASDPLSLVPITTNPIIYPSSYTYGNDDVESGTGSWTATGLWHRETGPTCLQAHSGSGSSWYYGSTTSCNFNNAPTSGNIALTFTATGSKITRSSGSFITDGFTPGAWITTTSISNPGPFNITNVTADTINVSGAILDEIVTATVTGASTTNSGTLTSGTIALPAETSSQLLSFWYYYETESTGTSYDQRWVQISTDGGTTFTNLTPTPLSGDTMNTWIQKTIDLSAYAGMNIKLRFYFNTVDSAWNNYKGWYIDDISITAGCDIGAHPAAWTITGDTTSCRAVDDPASDGNATYIQNQSTADPIVLNYDYTGAQSGTIQSIDVIVTAEKVQTSTKTRRIQGLLQIGGVNRLSPSAATLGTTYSAYTFNWPTNPATGAAWTWSDIKAAGIGSIKGFGLVPEGGTTIPTAVAYPRVTRIQLRINLFMPSGGPYNTIVDQGMVKATGIIDSLGSSSRFGLMYYATGANGGEVKTYIDFGSTTSMITSISGMSPSGYTPLGETLYEATRYFEQVTPGYANSPADYQRGNNYDPYYYQYSKLDAALADKFVPCAKSFVMFLTDGESTQDTSMPAGIQKFSWGKGLNPDGSPTGSVAGNPRLGGTPNGQTYTSSGTDYMIDVAYYARTTDHRTASIPGGTVPDLTGNQNVVLYPIYLFGKGSTLLKDAAIYGGFDDKNKDGKPGPSVEEYLRDSNEDGFISDGTDGHPADDPATYFEGDDGYELESSIKETIASILKRSASGTSVAVLATSGEGEGALYQAYFYPEKTMDDGSNRTWFGYCRGLFLDSYGNLRENTTDSDPNKKAMVFKDDKIMRMRFDQDVGKVKIDLYNDADEDMLPDAGVPVTIDLDDPKTIWEAGKGLAMKTKSARNIYAWVDADNDGVVDNGDFSSPAGEAMSFASANAATLQPYLNATTGAEATNIINFIRGNYIAGYRNRCFTLAGAGTADGCSGTDARTWPLGDIVYASPTAVTGTQEQYNLIYGGLASNYAAFAAKYNNRRHIVFTGSNDGVLHAFNGGIYTAGNDPSTSTTTEHGWFAANPSNSDGVDTDGDGNDTDIDGWGAGQGEELWSFLMHDNLPHLKWLTQEDYSHVYYVDLKPKPTDVRIFCRDATADSAYSSANYPSSCINGQSGASHPNGWGTILIVGMRFGGGAMDVTSDFDNDPGTPNTTRTFRSAYYVLDITNSEKAPRLLWRFTNTGLGFTTSYPGIAHILEKDPDTGAVTGEKWFMVVGSGPDNNAPSGTRGYKGTSTQEGKIFIVNLLNGTATRTFDTDTNAFMGDPTIVDGNLDYTTDVIYIGNAYNPPGAPDAWRSGKIYRINTNNDPAPANWRISTLINQDKPVLAGSSVAPDAVGNLWVFFGTGRLWSDDDKTDSSQQRFYGIKDACWRENSASKSCTTTYTLADLKNTSALSVCSSAAGGGIYTGSCGSGAAVYGSFNALISDIRKNYKGWYVDLSTNGTNPSEMVLAKGVLLGGALLFTSFTPDPDICKFQGDGNLYILHYETGTAYYKPTVGTSGSGTSESVLKSRYIGEGVPTGIGVLAGEKLVGFVQASTGELIRIEIEGVAPPISEIKAWREKTGGAGTSEIETIYKHIVK